MDTRKFNLCVWAGLFSCDTPLQKLIEIYKKTVGATDISAPYYICKTCPAGSYINSATEQCTLCPSGTYSATSNSSSCTPCPAGTYTETAGATSASFCKPCPNGYYCPGGTDKKQCGTWYACNAERGVGTYDFPNNTTCAFAINDSYEIRYLRKKVRSENDLKYKINCDKTTGFMTFNILFFGRCDYVSKGRSSDSCVSREYVEICSPFLCHSGISVQEIHGVDIKNSYQTKTIGNRGTYEILYCDYSVKYHECDHKSDCSAYNCHDGELSGYDYVDPFR